MYSYLKAAVLVAAGILCLIMLSFNSEPPSSKKEDPSMGLEREGLNYVLDDLVQMES